MTHKIPDTMKYDVQSIKCNKRKGFIKDYYKFISDKDTKIELMLYFDGSMSGDDAKQVQDLMKTLSCLLYTSPSPRDQSTSRMPSSA